MSNSQHDENEITNKLHVKYCSLDALTVITLAGLTNVFKLRAFRNKAYLLATVISCICDDYIVYTV